VVSVVDYAALVRRNTNIVSSNLTTGSRDGLQMIEIKNVKTYKGDGFRVGRPSPLGNPFLVDAKTSRTMAIAQYREWLLKRLETDNPTSKAFMVLVEYYRREGSMTLICHCSPLSCHAEVIREFVLEAIDEMGDKKVEITS